MVALRFEGSGFSKRTMLLVCGETVLKRQSIIDGVIRTLTAIKVSMFLMRLAIVFFSEFLNDSQIRVVKPEKWEFLKESLELDRLRRM